MLLKDILKARQEGKAVDIKGVKLGTVSTSQRCSLWWTDDDKLRMKLQMVFDLSSVGGKSFNDNVDVPEVSLSTKPKYDPCREFVPGDKVRMRERDGRHPYCMRMREHIVPSGTILTVATNLGNGLVSVRADGNPNEQVVGFYFLELITPVEELEPYSVTYSTDTSDECGRFEVVRGEQCVSIYPYGTHETRYYKKAEHAKAAAEAECARLNAEYRKEQK